MYRQAAMRMILYEANTNQYAPRAAGARINNTATIGGGAGVTNPVTAAEAVTTAESCRPDHQQGSLPAGRYQPKRCIDPHLYDSEQR